LEIIELTDRDLSIRGDPQEFKKIKISTLLLKIVYPVVLSYFYRNKGAAEASKHLINIGLKTSTKFARYHTPKSDNIKKVLKEMMNYWGPKYKIKENKEDSTYTLYTKHCTLCKDMPELDLEGMHYCSPVSGFIEGYLNSLISIKNPSVFPFESFSASVIKSMGSGDPYCEVELKVKRRQ